MAPKSTATARATQIVILSKDEVFTDTVRQALSPGQIVHAVADLRAAAEIAQGCHVAPGTRALVVPGSGAVKITGAHDFNDYAVAKRGNIPCYRLMDTKGAMRADGAS